MYAVSVSSSVYVSVYMGEYRCVLIKSRWCKAKPDRPELNGISPSPLLYCDGPLAAAAAAAALHLLLLNFLPDSKISPKEWMVSGKNPKTKFYYLSVLWIKYAWEHSIKHTSQVLQRMVELNWGFIILHPHFLLFLNNLLLDVSGSTGRNKYRPTRG